MQSSGGANLISSRFSKFSFGLFVYGGCFSSDSRGIPQLRPETANETPWQKVVDVVCSCSCSGGLLIPAAIGQSCAALEKKLVRQ